MQLFPLAENDVQLDMELCRAMFEKNPEKLLELVSDWLETHQLEPGDDFQVPAYLNAILSRSDVARDTRCGLRLLQS